MKGFALLEVLLALTLLAFGLLNILGMQFTATRYTHQSNLEDLALTQLSAMMDRLRANRTPEARQRELQQWNSQNTSLLPSGIGNYTCFQDNCVVNLHWQDRTLQALSLSGQL
ncbi:MAG: pilus assembly protein PilV [Gammaproteobacteria bacterium]